VPWPSDDRQLARLTRSVIRGPRNLPSGIIAVAVISLTVYTASVSLPSTLSTSNLEERCSSSRRELTSGLPESLQRGPPRL